MKSVFKGLGMTVLSQDFPSIARRAASRLAVELQEPTLIELVESELAKLERGEPVSAFEAGMVETLGLVVATAALLLQAISTGIEWQEHSNPQVPPNSAPSCEQVVEIIQQNITIDESIPPEKQILIINIVSEEIVNQINPNTQAVP